MALVKDIQDRIREVAYMMWDSAGRQHGMAMDYWLRAEREVITTMQSAAERMMPEPPRGENDGSTQSDMPAPTAEAPAKVKAETEAAPAVAPAAPAAPQADKPASKPKPAAAKKTPAAKPVATAKDKDKEPAKKPATRRSGTRASGKTSP